MPDNRQDALKLSHAEPLDDATMRTFYSNVRGQVILPDEAIYNEARTVFYGGFDRHPAAIVRVKDASDIARVVSLARESGLELAIKSGGHSLAGHSVSEGGIVLDLSEMKNLEFDTEGRTAWAQTGLTAGEYTAAVGAHGLATGFGDTGSVGIGGITLGGGVGFLVRKHGLTIDDVLAAEIVTADGELVYVDAESHPNLFWAIRGGGGNFGVVTSFLIRGNPVSTVYAGPMFWELDQAEEILRWYREFSPQAPEDMYGFFTFLTVPPAPPFPEHLHGKKMCGVIWCYSGAMEGAEEASGLSASRSARLPSSSSAQCPSPC